MKPYFFSFLIFLSTLPVFSENFITKRDGNFNSPPTWQDNNAPGVNSVNKWSGGLDTVFVNHNVFTPNTLAINGGSMVMVVKENASVTVNGGLSMNNSTLIIEENGDFTVEENFTTSNTSGSDLLIQGNFNINGNADQVAGSWNIGSSGKLNIGGAFNNNSSQMDFSNNGKVNIGGDVSFHNGNFNMGENSEFTAEGTNITVGHATVVNDGYMGFTNVTNVQTWSGSWDCDGGLGNGTVAFEQDVNCELACSVGSGKCSANQPLPVEWLDVFLKTIDSRNMVYWSTASETNNDYFEIQKSYNATEWFGIGTVSGESNSKTLKSYAFEDPENISETAYYRIAQVDLDGKTAYSRMMVHVPEEIIAGKSGLYPNPNTGNFSMVVDASRDIKSIQIKDVYGYSVQVNYTLQANILKIQLQESALAGLYTLTLETENSLQKTSFIVK